jgi:hypothetical protein
MYKSFSEFSEHIVTSHEEGRDYILCPLKRCGAPVRDIRAHFKCIHKNEPIPKKGMMKAIVWHDPVSKGDKKTKVRKPKFREGFYQSTKMNKQFHYRSGYEAKVYEYLDIDIDVASYDVEPFEIEYIHKGKYHRYVPDIIVKYIDGHTEVLEIKPATQTLLEVNHSKWTAADKACKTRGWQFMVVTEKGIDNLKTKVRNQQAFREHL